jgi:hypothetical protein
VTRATTLQPEAKRLLEAAVGWAGLGWAGLGRLTGLLVVVQHQCGWVGAVGLFLVSCCLDLGGGLGRGFLLIQRVCWVGTGGACRTALASFKQRALAVSARILVSSSLLQSP